MNSRNILRVVGGALLTSCAVVWSQCGATAGITLGPGHPGLLMPAIMQAYESGTGRIVIPRGEYKLPEPSGGFYLSFDDMRNFQIIGKGVTLLRTDPTKGGILFRHCSNVTLDGVTLRCDPLPFTQGRIIAVDHTSSYLEIQVCRGYPALGPAGRFAPSGFGDVFNPSTRRIERGTPDVWYARIDNLGSGRYRLFSKNTLGAKWVGKIMAIRGVWHPDVQLLNCSRMLVTKVKVVAGTGFCFCEGGGGGRNQYLDDVVAYPPTPHGANVRPMISSNADGFHSGFYPVGVRHGPTLIGCRFEGTDDDGIAIHGAYVMLQNIHGRNIIISSYYGDFVRPGDALKFYGHEGGYDGEAHVVRISDANGYKPRRRNGRVPATHAPQFYAAVLNRRVPRAVSGDLISDVDRNGSGFTIRDCTVENNRARGMLIKADDGVIAHNTIDGSSMEGIVVTPEINWGEAGSSCNLLIADNTVMNVGYADVVPAYMAGAVSVVARPFPHFHDTAIGHNNILIVANRIVDNNGLNLLLTDVRNVLLANNVFVNPMRKPDDRGADFHFDTSSLIWLQQCRNVLMADNQVINPGVAMKKIVGVGSQVRAIKGANTGFAVHAAGQTRASTPAAMGKIRYAAAKMPTAQATATPVVK